MSGPESAIENAVCLVAKENGWFVRKARWIGRVGCPDRVFAKDGRTVWIEFKAPNEPLRPVQRREIKRMLEAGFEVYVADSVKQALAFLGIEA